MKYRGYTVWGLYIQTGSLCTLLGFPTIFYIHSGIQAQNKTCKFKCEIFFKKGGKEDLRNHRLVNLFSPWEGDGTLKSLQPSPRT